MDPIVVKTLIELVSGHAYANEENLPIQWQTPIVGNNPLFTAIDLVANTVGLTSSQVKDILRAATIPEHINLALTLLNIISGIDPNNRSEHANWYNALVPGYPAPIELVAAITGVTPGKLLRATRSSEEAFVPMPPTREAERCAACREKLHEFNVRPGATICRRCEAQGVAPPPLPPAAPRPSRPKLSKELFSQIVNNMDLLGELAGISRINTTSLKTVLEKFGFDFKLARRNSLLHVLKDMGFVDRVGGKRGPTAFFKPTNKLLNLTSEPESPLEPTEALETTEAPIEPLTDEEMAAIPEIEQQYQIPLTVSEADRAPSIPFQDELNIENRYALRLEVSPKDQRHIYKDLRFASKVVGIPLAGSFKKWAGLGELFRDEEFINKFLNKLTEHIENNESEWANFEIEYSEPVGWADTVPLQWLPENIAFHPKRIINKKTKTPTILHVVEDHGVPGPETNIITVGVNIRTIRGGGGEHVNVIRLYPGPFVGAITVSKEAGQSPSGTQYVFLSKEMPYPPGDTQGFWPSVVDAKQREETATIEKQQMDWTQQKQNYEAEMRDLVLLALNEESDPITIEQLAENSGLDPDSVRLVIPAIQDQITQAHGTYILNTKITASPSPTPVFDVTTATPELRAAPQLHPIEKLALTAIQKIEIRPNQDIFTNITVKTDAGEVLLTIVIPRSLRSMVREHRCAGPKAGNFLVYKSIEQALAKDPVLWNALSNRLQAFLRKQVHASGSAQFAAAGVEVDFTINHQNLIGWSDNVPAYFIDQMKDAKIEKKTYILDRIFTGRELARRPKLQADIVRNIPAPLTNLITFHGGLSYDEEHQKYIFYVRDLYPGQSLGNLTEGPFNLTQRNVYLFDLEAPGEDPNTRETTLFIAESVKELQKKMEREWVSSKLTSEDYSDQIKMPQKVFEQEILRPIGLTPGHKQISGLGKAQTSETRTKKKKKGPATNRRILFVGGNKGIGGLRALQANRDFLTENFYFEEIETQRGGAGGNRITLPTREDWDLIVIFSAYMGHPQIDQVKAKYGHLGIPILASVGTTPLRALPGAAVAAEKSAPWFYEAALHAGLITKRRRNPNRGEDVCRLVETNRDYVSDQYNLRFEQYLGAGKDGCVYRYEDDKVIKFSLSTKEAKFAAYLSSAKHVSGFPRIHYVDRITLPDFKPSIYVIIKEDVPSIQLPEIIVELMVRMCEIANPKKSVEAISDQLYSYLDHVFGDGSGDPNLTEMNELLLHHFADFLIWCADKYIYISDVSRRNIGLRTEENVHSLVLRDFSYCEVVT